MPFATHKGKGLRGWNVYPPVRRSNRCAAADVERPRRESKRTRRRVFSIRIDHLSFLKRDFTYIIYGIQMYTVIVFMYTIFLVLSLSGSRSCDPCCGHHACAVHRPVEANVTLLTELKPRPRAGARRGAECGRDNPEIPQTGQSEVCQAEPNEH